MSYPNVVQYALAYLAASVDIVREEGMSDEAADLYRVLWGEDLGERTFALDRFQRAPEKIADERRTYNEAIQVARDWCDPLDETRGSEYARGQMELIADLWGVPGMYTATRVEQIEEDIFGPHVPARDHEHCAGGSCWQNREPCPEGGQPPVDPNHITEMFYFTESDTADAREDQERDTNIMAMNLEPVNAQELDELRDILECMEKEEGNAKLRYSEALNLLRGIVRRRSHGPFPLPGFDDIERRLQHLESEDARIETRVDELTTRVTDLETDS